ncbi:hypothetical protein [Persicitalea sp.]|uniref:hypothetical protein n=1 Tax=Persicitalea sp. TaxID=3100273 RepID=UPI003593E85D
MLLRTLSLICLSLTLLSLSCGRDPEPDVIPGDGTFTANATGGLSFNVSGEAKAGVIYYAVKKETVLSIELVAPDNRWSRFVFNVWNYNREGVRDKLYLVYPGTSLPDEAVSGSLRPDASSTGWVDFNAGQIQFEYYGTDRVRGTFDAILKSNDPRLPKVEDIKVTGSFDTSFQRINK